MRSSLRVVQLVTRPAANLDTPLCSEPGEQSGAGSGCGVLILDDRGELSYGLAMTRDDDLTALLYSSQKFREAAIRFRRRNGLIHLSFSTL
jgi:hypothetical protein